MIFVDTGAWFAAYVPKDPDHTAAVSFLASTTERLVTTDYVVDELLTLLRRRGQHQRALVVGEALLRAGACRLEWITPADIDGAWSVYQLFSDKNWSFTDCVSRVVMERLGIRRAFAFDEHFRQFATVEVLP